MIILVGMERLELSRVAPHGPQPCAYTSSATSPIYQTARQLQSAATISRYFDCALTFAFFVAALFELLAFALLVFAFVLVSGTAAGTTLGAGVAGAAGAGVGVGSACVDCSTEREPVSAGRESMSAANMKRTAAPMVIFASSVCVPRGPN